MMPAQHKPPKPKGGESAKPTQKAPVAVSEAPAQSVKPTQKDPSHKAPSQRPKGGMFKAAVAFTVKTAMAIITLQTVF
jgi:hypothetical protein